MISCSSPLFRLECEPDNLRVMKDNFPWITKLHSPYNGGIFINSKEFDHIPKIFRHRFSQIGCGQCIGCRLDRAREWSYRCMIEAKEYPFNYFVTLTYSDSFLPPFRGSPDPVTGETFSSELRRKDLQGFIKRLRSYCKYHFNHSGIRVFYCGEYGSLGRPHYHMILFNMPELKDLVFHSQPSGSPLYISDTIQRCWMRGNDFIGFSIVGDVTLESCNYVARYIMKKQTGENSPSKRHKSFKRYRASIFYYKYDCRQFSRPSALRFKGWSRPRVQEFIGMSNRPGIGASFLDRNREDIFKYDQIVFGTKKGPFSLKPFRYYEKRFDVDINSTWFLEDLKESRKLLALSQVPLRPAYSQQQKNLFMDLRNRDRNSKLRRYLD